MNKTYAAVGIIGAAVAVAVATPASGATNPLAPPTGSVTLTAPETLQGVQYARYSNASMTPAQVLAAYTKQLQSAGYQTVNEGGGGSGWSDAWGGGGGGLTGIKTGTYFSVNAGGDGSPTYFEVCYGPNSQVVNNCQNVSQNQSQSQGS